MAIRVSLRSSLRSNARLASGHLKCASASPLGRHNMLKARREKSGMDNLSSTVPTALLKSVSCIDCCNCQPIAASNIGQGKASSTVTAIAWMVYRNLSVEIRFNFAAITPRRPRILFRLHSSQANKRAANKKSGENNASFARILAVSNQLESERTRNMSLGSLFSSALLTGSVLRIHSRRSARKLS